MNILEKYSIPEPNSGCTLWLGETRNKYGVVKFNGKKILAHRLSWIFENGPIPDGKVIMHQCDNPKCINTNHLKLGTQLENIEDMIKKGRRHLKYKIRKQNALLSKKEGK